MIWASWSPLGRLLGALFGPLGGLLGRLGAILGVLERSWAVLEASWTLLGASWGPLGPFWGPLASGKVTRGTPRARNIAQEIWDFGFHFPDRISNTLNTKYSELKKPGEHSTF